MDQSPGAWRGSSVVKEQFQYWLTYHNDSNALQFFRVVVHISGPRSPVGKRQLVVFEIEAFRQAGRIEFDGLGRHVNVRIAGGEGVAAGEGHGFGAIVAEGSFVLAADDGEGVEDAGDGV